MKNNYSNAITKYLDEITKCVYTTHYFYYESRKRRFAIRMPGSTIGEILLDENDIIQKINLGGGLFKYTDEEIEKVNTKFVGTKYDFDSDEPFKLGKLLRARKSDIYKRALCSVILIDLIAALPLEEEE